MIMYLKQETAAARTSAQETGALLDEVHFADAIAKGALRRLRPVMMTFAVIFAGLLPIMYGHGTGGEVMRRIAAPMIGGIVSATMLALVVIPAAYFLWNRRALGRVEQYDSQQPQPAPAE
jgi:Cu(I)/Ag(I) efflux system membrane protein CusA/SilA